MRGARRGGARIAGIIGAGIAGAVLVTGVILVVARSPGHADSEVQEMGTRPPDIRELPAGKSDGTTGLGGGKEIYIQFADRNDPGRVAGEIRAATSEPLEGKRYELTRPRAWRFLKDGRSVYIEGDSGRAYIPDTGPGSRPEEGTLRGHVVIKIFPAGATRPDPARDKPEVTATTNSLHFNGTLGELHFDEPLDLVGERFTFKGEGVTVLFNEVQQRLELVRCEKALAPFVWLPPPPADAAMPVVKPAAFHPRREEPASLRKPAPPVESYYHLRCNERVVVEQGGRTIHSDRLDGWARLFDNRLREGAIASDPARAPQRVSKLCLPAARPGEVLAALALAAVQPPQGALLAGAEPLSVMWEGPAEIRPLNESAAELAADDAFVRFSSAAADATTFADKDGTLSGKGRLIDYGATQREAALIGTPESRAVITLKGSGYAVAERFNLSLNTGEASVPGGGAVYALSKDRQAPPETPPSRGVTWSRDATFRFALGEDGQMTSRISEARLYGDANARDADASLSGESMIAGFAPGEDNSARLSNVNVIGRAHADDAKGGTLDSDKLAIDFAAPEPGDPSRDAAPTHLLALGNVVASRDQSTLKAESLNADLHAADGHHTGVTRVLAEHSVVYSDTDGTAASADRLEADPIKKTAVLTGIPARVAHADTTVSGGTILLLQDSRKLEVPGEGEFQHHATGDDGSPEVATARWAKGMTYDDPTGLVVANGGVEAVLTRGELERHTMSGERVEIAVEPAKQGGGKTRPDASREGVVPGLAPPGAKGESRRLLSVRVYADEAAPPESRSPALVTLQRFMPPLEGQPGPRLERELRLSGSSIFADNAASTIDVPNAGTCRVLDMREETGEPKSSLLPTSTTTPRGGARFTWQQSMHFERPSGTLNMTGAVSLAHVRLADNAKTELECDELTARVREKPPGANEPAPASPEDLHAELLSALAKGSVWMRSNGKEMTAQVLDYDAEHGLADATAPGGGTVTYFDPATGSPIEATRVHWDLIKDRVEISGIKPVVAPR